MVEPHLPPFALEAPFVIAPATEHDSSERVVMLQQSAVLELKCEDRWQLVACGRTCQYVRATVARG
eukprot:scaffold106404_cov64-Phaeocystis_antarctica.AAC.2